MRTRTVALDRVGLVQIFMITVLALAAMGLSGCNTTAGLGRDIQSAGSALERSADDASD